MARERISGTLERLMSVPIGRGDVVAGDALAGAAVALALTAIAPVYRSLMLRSAVAGPVWAELPTARLVLASLTSPRRTAWSRPRRSGHRTAARTG